MPSVFLIRRTPQALRKARQALSGSHWRCVGEAERVEGADEQIRRLRPDMLACELRLFDGHAARLLRRLGRAAPATLLLTPCAEDPLLFDCLRLGARGYWLDGNRGESLDDALESGWRGHAGMSPQLARQALAAFGLPRSRSQLAQSIAAASDQNPAADSDGAPTVAQQHLLSLVSSGLLDREIAQRWQLSLEEVRRRLAGIYAALHAQQQGASLALA